MRVKNLEVLRALKRLQLGMALSLACVPAAYAEIANHLEPDYAEAVLAYNARNYSRALQILNELHAKAPKTIEFLELKAITLKANQQIPEAGNVYRELVQIKTNSGSPKKEIAPYAFELGIIRFNERKFQQAEQYLQYAVRSDFNVDVAHLYLGLAGVQTTQWDKAEMHFQKVVDGKLDALKPAGHFYLGQVYFQKQVPANGFGEWMTAKRLAEKNLTDSDASSDSRAMAEQIVKGVDTALAPFNKGQSFANFSAIVGYDSNVLLVPNESDARATATPEATVKTTFSAGAGYATSPLNRYQLVPSLRFNANKNFNRETASGEFSESGASLYVTRDALSARAFGARLDFAIIFQNEYNQATDTSKYRLYTTTFTFAPYLKADLNRDWVFNGEAGVRAVSFNGDQELTSAFQRNGPAYFLRGGLQSKSAKKYFNPGFSVKADYTNTKGTEFRAFAYGAGVNNSFQLKEVQLTQTLDITRTEYGKSSTDRGDTLASVMVSGYRKIGPRWALLASIDYTKNQSSDEAAYAYNRYSMNAGISYSF